MGGGNLPRDMEGAGGAEELRDMNLPALQHPQGTPRGRGGNMSTCAKPEDRAVPP